VRKAHEFDAVKCGRKRPVDHNFDFFPERRVMPAGEARMVGSFNWTWKRRATVAGGSSCGGRLYNMRRRTSSSSK
jgi:hypothetical protein